jgi:hypothetical protein
MNERSAYARVNVKKNELAVKRVADISKISKLMI